MNPRTFRFSWLLLLAVAAGCVSTTGPITVRPEALGAFVCVDRGAVASPPPRGILGLGSVRGEQKTIVQREARPLLTLRPCGEGRVPVSKTPALPTVAKGNPLIGATTVRSPISSRVVRRAR